MTGSTESLDQKDESLQNVLIFSGSAHRLLSADIAAYLNLKVSPSSCDKFSNDNLDIRLGVSVRGKDVFIIQPLSPPASDNLLELIMMLDIARTSGAKSIHAVIPYYSYARSDKKDAPRISVAGRLVADLLVTAGAQHIITMTLHSPQVHGFFNIHTDHLTAHSAFVNHFKTRNLENCVVVSPDMGNAKRAAKLARSLGVPLAVAEKLRLTDEKVTITAILGDVEGKRVLLLDDEIATAGTMMEVLRVLKEKGAGAITIVCTHGLFTGPAVERLNNMPEIEEIVTTNTVPLTPERRPSRLKSLSIAHIFGEVIKRSVIGGSVGELFEFWPTS